MIRYGRGNVVSSSPVCRSPKTCCVESGVIYSLADSQSEMLGASPKCSPLQMMFIEVARSLAEKLSVEAFIADEKFVSGRVSGSGFFRDNGSATTKMMKMIRMVHKSSFPIPIVGIVLGGSINLLPLFLPSGYASTMF